MVAFPTLVMAVKRPASHEGAPLAAEFLAPAQAKPGHVTGQDVAFLALVMLGADLDHGADRVPPRRRADRVPGGLADELPDVLVDHERVLHRPDGVRVGAGYVPVAGLLLSLGVRDQQVGEALPDMAEHPVGAWLAARVLHGAAQAPDPAVIGHDQLDDVG